MPTADVDAIGEFLARYRSFDESWRSRRLEQLAGDLRRLHDGIAEASARDTEERRRTASAFNIFRVLNRMYDEVGTHSALLANLLNPHGSHGQGPLFLERFLVRYHYAVSGAPPLLELVPDQGWIVSVEKPTPYGSLDVVLESPSLGYLCVIENKLLAGEQPDQLARYSRWLHEQSRYPYRALFYLTPDGRPSSTSNGAVYYRLSYRTDIVAWLEETLHAVEAPRLADLLRQYVDVLKCL